MAGYVAERVGEHDEGDMARRRVAVVSGPAGQKEFREQLPPADLEELEDEYFEVKADDVDYEEVLQLASRNGFKA